MISDILFPLLQKKFPGCGIADTSSSNPCYTFPAKHSEFGDILIYDDGDEITLCAGNLTHSHFSNYEDISEEEKKLAISEDVVRFLTEVFSDRVVFFTQRNSGGWHAIDPNSPDRERHEHEFVWSGPLIKR